MLTYARTHIVIAYTHQTQGLTGILWQSVEFHIGRNMVAVYKLIGHRHIKRYQPIHLRLYRLLFLTRRFVVYDKGHLAFLALNMSIATALAREHTNHQLIEQMLCRMSRRKLFLVMLIQNKLTLFHLDIEFIDSYSMRLNIHWETSVFLKFYLLLVTCPEFCCHHLFLCDMEEVEGMSRNGNTQLA